VKNSEEKHSRKTFENTFKKNSEAKQRRKAFKINSVEKQ
jgi:hypothetical protein